MSRNGKNNKGGYECSYDFDISVKICEAVASSTDNIQDIIKRNNFPSSITIRRWRHKFPEFEERFQAAKKEQIKLCLEEHKQIIKNVVDNHSYVDKEGNRRIDAAAVALAKLEMDDNKWFASKLIPAQYGDKMETTIKIDKVEDWLDKIKDVD